MSIRHAMRPSKLLALVATLVGVILVADLCMAGPPGKAAEKSKPDLAHENGGVALIPGVINIGKNGLSKLDTQTFICTLSRTLKKEEKISAYFVIGHSRHWLISESKHSFTINGKTITYPDVTLLTEHALLTGILKPRIGIAAGQTVNADGYQITVGRAINSSDSIPVFVIISGGRNAVLSIESSPDGRMPWFSAFRDGTQPADRRSAVDAWVMAKRYAPIYWGR
jgi:hypothetical protein